MIDARFYQRLGPVPARDLAEGAELRGDPEFLVRGVASLGEAAEDELAYFDGKGALTTRAKALIVSPKVEADGRAVIVAKQPRAHFSRVAAKLAVERVWETGGPAISPDALIEEGVKIGPGVVIGAGAQIGAMTVLGPNTVIGPGVAVGRRCQIGAGVVIMCALIGDDVTLLPGAKLGQPGFGIAVDSRGPVDVPHFGRVIVQDAATIGANSTVDRGVFGDTTIGERAKIDNLCHVAHNASVGAGVIMAAFAGIAGSSSVGDGAILGGKVGISDHLAIGRGGVVAAGSSVMHDVPAGERWAGYPAKPMRKWLRETVWLSRAIGKRDVGSTE
jgi:UDP-3-O-[3-hydroxymyristoyl] glucosamine N-acyltransferase